MKFTKVRDLRYSSEDKSTIDLLATCQEYGEIPMTLNIRDTEDIHTFFDGKKEYPLEEYCLTKTIAPYIKPEEVHEVVFIPTSITQRQCRLMLVQIGKYQEAVAFIENSQDDTIKIEWEYASTIERNNPLVSTLGEQLGLTKEQLDSLFVEASKL
ncbi:hypothetical protein [Aliarcobacter butzleri]|uniref:hypothetical protein n=1 Tax=Aliarcobacter butzleri TaxID=28197 RepID=UPI002876092C|nr:hypothetical protein [Aliarcobacter butzleri]MDS1315329.1 hypothetical protein [Aliarcobacter butzleri]